ncbi:MAG: acyl-CoA dehydrogenase family protein, partial [Acidimicrobiia bacterium]
MAEELARGESALIDIILQGWKVGQILAAHGGAEVRRHWLGRFAAEPRLLFSHCSSEPQGSSDRWLNHDVPEAAMRTTAVRDDSGWVINGRKQFITNGPDASLYVVYATTTPGVVPSQGTSSFLVPPDTPGFTIGETHEKMGGRLFNNAELVFEDCRVTDDHLLILDEAGGTSGRTFPVSKAIIGAQAVGLAQAAYEAAAGFATRRVQGGRPIIQH